MEENSFVLNNHEDLKGKKILIAEDNLLNQIIIRKILEKWNVEFDIVDNGQKAVDKVSEKLYDIVLMDIQMPVMDGYESSNAIRALSVQHAMKVPIIALTASVNDELIDLITAAGMNNFLIKPYSPEALHEMILKYV